MLDSIFLEPPDDPSEFREDEDQLEQRLIQLLNLPIHHMPPTQSTYSHSTHSAEVDSLQGQENGDPTFLSLDCAELAECLSALPMHQRLDIDLDLVELCEAEGNTSDESQAVSNVLEGINLSACAKRRTYTFEFKSKEHVLGREHSSTSASSTTSTSNNRVTKKGDLATIKHLEEDEELDKLLESSLSQHQRTPKESTVLVMPNSTKEQLSPPVVVQDNSMNNVELDDMLDELLR